MPLVKTGTESAVSPALKDKTGMPPADHADAQLDQAGMESPVSAVMEEDNGTPFQSHAHAHQETGTDSHALPVPLVNNGIHQLSHAHAQPILSGMVLIAEPALVETDSGAIN